MDRKETSIEEIFMNVMPLDDWEQTKKSWKIVMNSQIIYVSGYSAEKWKCKINRRKKNSMRAEKITKNIEKFELQIIRKETDNEGGWDEKVVNRLESNSIKEINLIGFWTFSHFPFKSAFQTLLSGKNWV